ncbi:MAG: hypothetical protein V4487_07135 [Chlamydiota bacterium]
MLVIPAQIHPLASRQIPSLPSNLKQIVKKIALACFAELALSLVLTAVVAAFVATPTGITVLLGAVIVQFAVGAFFRSLGAFAEFKAGQPGSNRAKWEFLNEASSWICGGNFAFFSGSNAQTIIHEKGHELAAKLLYKNSNPIIQINPFEGGYTEYSVQTLTPFGKKLGESRSTFLTVASGPALTLAVSSLCFSIGMIIKETKPSLSKYLLSLGALDFFSHALYALSAIGLSKKKLANDFVHLSLFGIHPIAAAIIITATPILLGLGITHLKNQTPPQLPAPVV